MKKRHKPRRDRRTKGKTHVSATNHADSEEKSLSVPAIVPKFTQKPNPSISPELTDCIQVENSAPPLSHPPPRRLPPQSRLKASYSRSSKDSLEGVKTAPVLERTVDQTVSSTAGAAQERQLSQPRSSPPTSRRWALLESSIEAPSQPSSGSPPSSKHAPSQSSSHSPPTSQTSVLRTGSMQSSAPLPTSRRSKPRRDRRAFKIKWADVPVSRERESYRSTPSSRKRDPNSRKAILDNEEFSILSTKAQATELSETLRSAPPSRKKETSSSYWEKAQANIQQNLETDRNSDESLELSAVPRQPEADQLQPLPAPVSPPSQQQVSDRASQDSADVSITDDFSFSVLNHRESTDVMIEWLKELLVDMKEAAAAIECFRIESRKEVLHLKKQHDIQASSLRNRIHDLKLQGKAAEERLVGLEHRNKDLTSKLGLCGEQYLDFLEQSSMVAPTSSQSNQPEEKVEEADVDLADMTKASLSQLHVMELPSPRLPWDMYVRGRKGARATQGADTKLLTAFAQMLRNKFAFNQSSDMLTHQYMLGMEQLVVETQSPHYRTRRGHPKMGRGGKSKSFPQEDRTAKFPTVPNPAGTFASASTRLSACAVPFSMPTTTSTAIATPEREYTVGLASNLSRHAVPFCTSSQPQLPRKSEENDKKSLNKTDQEKRVTSNFVRTDRERSELAASMALRSAMRSYHNFRGFQEPQGASKRKDEQKNAPEKTTEPLSADPNDPHPEFQGYKTEEKYLQALATGDVVQISHSYYGSKYLQKILRAEEGKAVSPQIQEVMQRLLVQRHDREIEMMFSKCSRHVFAAMLPLLTEEEHTSLLSKLLPVFAACACDELATRSVQCLVEHLISETQFSLLLDHLQEHLPVLLEHPTGVYLVRCLIRTLPQSLHSTIDFVIKANLLSVCRMKPGIKLLSDYFAHFKVSDVEAIVVKILMHTLELAADQSANYVIQFLICYNEFSTRSDEEIKKLKEIFISARDHIASCLQGCYRMMCFDKICSNVIECLLKKLSHSHWLGLIVSELLAPPVETLLSLANDMFGNYVLRTAMAVAPSPLQRVIVQHVVPLLPMLHHKVRHSWEKLLTDAGCSGVPVVQHSFNSHASLIAFAKTQAPCI